MKFDFKKADILLLIAGIISIILYKMLDYDFFKIFSIVLLIFLIIIYFGFSWFLFKEGDKQFLNFSIFYGLVYSLALTGVLFKIAGLVGYSPLLLIGWLLLITILIPLALLRKNNYPIYFNLHLIRSSIVGILSVVFYFSDFIMNS